MLTAAPVPGRVSSDSSGWVAGHPLGYRRTRTTNRRLARDWSATHPEILQKAETLAELAQRDFVVAAVDTTLFNLLAEMQRVRASVAVVTAASGAGTASGGQPRIVGVVTQTHLAEAMAEGLELFGD